MNLLDRVIDYLFPAWASRRALSRHACRQFTGGDLDRLRSRRSYPSYGPKAENRQSREKLLAVARDLDRNNSFAHGAFNSLVNNIVGRGIEVEVRVQTGEGRLIEAINRKIETEWREWCRQADVRGQLTYAQIQQLAEREQWVAGEILIVRRTDRERDPFTGKRVPLRLEVIESERLAPIDGPVPGSSPEAGNEIFQGVEFGRNGRPVAYHVYMEHPGDLKASVKIQRIPAIDVLHLFHADRPNQVRGLSRIASVARNFEALGQYLDNELTRARIAASFALMIKRGGIGMVPKFPATADASDATDANGNPVGHIEGGMIFHGGPNDSLEGTGPAVQTSTIEPFIRVNLRAIAIGLNMSYEILARDFTQATFSSARQATQEDIRHWGPRQRFLNERLNDRVFQWFVDAAILEGIAPFAANERRLDWEWVTPTREYIDPQVEAEADILAIKAGFTNLQAVAAKHGGDVHENIRLNQAVKEEAEEAGLTLAPFEEEKPEPAAAVPAEPQPMQQPEGMSNAAA